MPVTATIPVTEDYREKLLSAGQFDNVIGWILGGSSSQYLFGTTQTTSYRFLRVSSSNLEDVSVLSFPVDGNHAAAFDLFYSPSRNRVYVIWANPTTVVISEINPDVTPMTYTDVVTEIGGVGYASISGNASYLYVVNQTNDPTVVSRYEYGTWAKTTLSLTGLTAARNVRVSGDIFVSGLQHSAALTNSWLAKIPVAFSSFSSAAFARGNNVAINNNDLVIIGSFAYLGYADSSGTIKKIDISTLAQSEILTGQTGRIAAVAKDGSFLWVLFDNGRAVRYNPTSGDQRIYTLNSGQNYLGNLASDSTYLYMPFRQTPTKIARYRIPSDVVSGTLVWLRAQENSVAVVNGVAVDLSNNLATRDSVVTTGNFRFTVNFGTGNIDYKGGALGDIFFAKYSSQNVPIRARGFGGGGEDIGQSVAIDSEGNIIVTGYFSSPILPPSEVPQAVDFGGTSRTSVGSLDIFVAKYNPAGDLLWVSRFGGSSGDGGRGIAVLPNDDIIMAGFYTSNATFGNTTLTVSGLEIVLVKINGSDGSVAWARGWGHRPSGDCRVFPNALALDSAGDIFITGQFNLPADFGNGEVNPGTNSLFVAKYSGVDGAYRWAYATGGSGDVRGFGIAIDPATQNVISTGVIQGTVNLGGGSSNITVTGPTLFLAGYNNSGASLWPPKTFANFGELSSGLGMSVKIRGGILALTGQINGLVEFAPNVFLPAGTDRSFFVSTFTIAGDAVPVYRWGKALGGSGSSIGNSVAFDSLGHVLVGGSFQQTKEFGSPGQSGGSATGSSGNSSFVAQYVQ